ncbi:hypothetical protein [Algibacillus agarilyticus]|uniref:hypothetical protein n=1 Tax=Algibacillus agarilyticus TaxID=2234133 RepID=UPI000DCFEE38|nr:hypothetical protein [Algibacillus agarilyticus]
MNTKLTNTLGTLSLLSLLSFNPVALAKAPQANAEFKTGIEHDSKLNIVELDQTSEVADTALTLNAKANINWQATDALTLKSSYNYNSKKYNRYDAFDLLIQQVSVDAEYDFNRFSLGASYHFADAELASNDFLTLQQTSLHYATLIKHQYYFRVATLYKDKKFENLADRNANNIGLSADSYVFYNSANTFITFGISTEAESADTAFYDYGAIGLKTGVSHKFAWLNLDHQVQVGWRWLDRQYDNLDPSLNTERNDTRRNTTAEWTLHFNDMISVVSKIDVGQHDSNLAAANYNETVSSIGLKAQF